MKKKHDFLPLPTIPDKKSQKIIKKIPIYFLLFFRRKTFASVSINQFSVQKFSVHPSSVSIGQSLAA